ncbi:MAG TPA: putative Ig domain-containing protein [Candidatus Acidoferrales bacterium]|nr:putative Ig domain-containing protein [Candidatus Acidoferrales bacterium]
MKIHTNRFIWTCILIGLPLILAGCEAGTPTKFHAVVLAPSTAQSIDQGGTLNISASVLNDASNAGVNWSVSGGGTLSATTTTSATYAAPATVSSPTTVTITATSVTYPSSSASLTVTVETGPAITTTSLSAATIGAPYNATVNESGGVAPFSWSIVSGPAWVTLNSSNSDSVTLAGTPGVSDAGTAAVTLKVTDADGASATSSGLTITVTNLAITTTSPLPDGAEGTPYSEQFSASGGTSPYAWSVASGSTLPAGLTLSATGLLSGTPTAAVSSATFDVTVTDSETPAVSVTQTFTLTISGSQNPSLLNGNFAFEFNGFNSSGAVVVAGSFYADGLGNLKTGVEDVNSIGGTPVNQTFTGTYTIGSDGRGQLVFSSISGSPTYDFVIDSAGEFGRMIEADSTGVHGSGQLQVQDAGFNVCTSDSLDGEYAFGLSGSSSSAGGATAGPVVVSGRFTATQPVSSGGQGSLSNGEMDANAPGKGLVEESLNSLSGTYQSTSQSARCTMSITTTTLPNMTFSVYPVSSSLFFLVETDNVSGNSSTPFLTVGQLRPQNGYPFSGLSGPFTGASIGGLVGQYLSGTSYVPDDAVMSIDPSGVGSFNISLTENRGGTLMPFSGSGTFINADQYGRVATQGLNNEIEPVCYAINTNQAFCIGSITGNPFFGILEPQSQGPFTAATIANTFIEGTAAPAATTVTDLSGVLTFDGSSVVGGTQDTAVASGQTVAGTYKLSSTGSTDGSGTITLTSPAAFTGSFYIISPNELVVVSTTSGDSNPQLIIIGHE